MTPEFMLACIGGDLNTAQRLLGATFPAGWPDNNNLLELRLRQLRTDPELQPWLLRAICLKATSELVGYIGFHTRPNPHYLRQWLPDAVEFGFTVLPAFRRNGYAREAALTLMEWANSAHGVSRFVLTIAPHNQPSQALATALGFKHIGSHHDEIDGLEDVLALEYAPVANPKVQNAASL
jgi:ribosomal-protein-alanine N-acetyltransferase